MSTPGQSSTPEIAEEAIWQQVEFGTYAADLPLWAELAEEADGPVLELGAGAGRVALHLAGHGHTVIALERERELAAGLERAAERAKAELEVVCADLVSPAELRFSSEPALVIGPLHVLQVLDGASRPAALSRLREVLSPGAIVALAVVDESTLLRAGAAASQILPDMREIDGWVFSSEPLWVQVGDATLTVRRLRERVSPGGEMKRGVHDEVLHRISPERLELEAGDAGFIAAGRRQVSSQADEADSTVVLLEAR
jgi:precorrin-6B methylase 2